MPIVVSDLLSGGGCMGTLHYFRFIALNESTVCFLADFDGELETVLEVQLMEKLK